VISDLQRYECELRQDPQLVERVLAMLPRVAPQTERVIRTSRQNVDRAIARGLARSVVFCELTGVQIAKECGVPNSESG
jgi:hypothetical protein